MIRDPRSLFMIAALDRNRVIGRDNDLPWHLPDDLRYFKEKTRGHPVIMGRKCYESIAAVLGGPLPGRRNIVLTRDESWQAAGVIVVHSVEDAVAAAGLDITPFVIGGGEIYTLFLPRATRLYLTEVDAAVEGDVRFPTLGAEWQETSRHHHAADEKHAHSFEFVAYEREDT